jgi:hypothetical protein
MRSVFSTIAPPWFTSAKHGFRMIDLAEMLCNLMADRIPAIWHTEELIVATARSIAGHTLRFRLQGTHYGMEVFMPRIPIVGLACSTFLILLSSSAVPQEWRAPTPGRGN